ncbi:MAG: hypothetical protein GY839_13875 [candidate division Zixibacteria bacterium]|nr:hypothetical protein [candidate division Zixibacteria bacterium]
MQVSDRDYTQHLLEVARMMELAARTAPKSLGQDFIEVKIISRGDVLELAKNILEFGKKTGKQNFDRDFENVKTVPVVVLIGLKGASALNLNCGACGFNTCEDLKKAPKTTGHFMGPVCALRHLDLGIALGSAVKTAQMMNVDNRIMYRIGVTARNFGIVDWDFVMGIPLSATGKNIFFDREKK